MPGFTSNVHNCICTTDDETRHQHFNTIVWQYCTEVTANTCSSRRQAMITFTFVGCRMGTWRCPHTISVRSITTSAPKTVIFFATANPMLPAYHSERLPEDTGIAALSILPAGVGPLPELQRFYTLTCHKRTNPTSGGAVPVARPWPQKQLYSWFL